MKRGLLLFAGFVLGGLELVGAALWCLSDRGHLEHESWMPTGDFTNVLIFMIAGPVLVLPLAFLARSMPKLAGLLLAAGGAFSAAWHALFVLGGPANLFRSGVPVEAWAPLAAASLPMMVLGFCDMKWLTAKEG